MIDGVAVSVAFGSSCFRFKPALYSPIGFSERALKNQKEGNCAGRVTEIVVGRAQSCPSTCFVLVSPCLVLVKVSCLVLSSLISSKGGGFSLSNKGFVLPPCSQVCCIRCRFHHRTRGGTLCSSGKLNLSSGTRRGTLCSSLLSVLS